MEVGSNCEANHEMEGFSLIIFIGGAKTTAKISKDRENCVIYVFNERMYLYKPLFVMKI